MADDKKYIPERIVRDNLGGKIRQVWDFDVNGGAVGVANLDVLLPEGAIVTGGFIHVLTAVTTSASGTLSFGLNTNVDLLAATAAGSLTVNAILPLIPSTTAALDGNAQAAGVTNSRPLRLTAERELKAEVATGALTAGKVAVYLEFIGPAKDIEPVTYRKY
jgi:hypothetical protein